MDPWPPIHSYYAFFSELGMISQAKWEVMEGVNL